METRLEGIATPRLQWMPELSWLAEECNELQSRVRACEHDGDLARAEAELYRFVMRTRTRIKRFEQTVSAH
jgi:hypothetical protein